MNNPKPACACGNTDPRIIITAPTGHKFRVCDDCSVSVTQKVAADDDRYRVIMWMLVLSGVFAGIVAGVMIDDVLTVKGFAAAAAVAAGIGTFASLMAYVANPSRKYRNEA